MSVVSEYAEALIRKNIKLRRQLAAHDVSREPAVNLDELRTLIEDGDDKRLRNALKPLTAQNREIEKTELPDLERVEHRRIVEEFLEDRGVDRAIADLVGDDDPYEFWDRHGHQPWVRR